jgi:putative Mn2+ efflux pump MntP
MAFSGASDEGRTYVLGNAIGGATLFVGLGHTTDTSTAPVNGSTLASITELSGAGYARQSCAMGTAASQASVGAQVTFSFTGTPTGGTATYWFLATTVSGTAGKIIGWVSLGSARTFVNLDTDKVTPTVAD